MPEKDQRNDKRIYTRVEIFVSARYEKTSRKKAEKRSYSRGELTRQGLIRNIGGGGIRLVVKDGIVRGDYLEISMNIPGLDKSYRLFGKVARVIGKDAERNVLGVQFVKMDESARAEIVHYILSEVKNIKLDGRGTRVLPALDASIKSGGDDTDSRRHTRVEFFVPAKYEITTLEKAGSGIPSQWELPCQGLVKDIGGGGVSMVVSDNITAGDHLEIELYLPRLSSHYRLFGKVMRVIEKDENRRTLGVQFVKMNEADRKEIVQYVLDEVKDISLEGNGTEGNGPSEHL